MKKRSNARCRPTSRAVLLSTALLFVGLFFTFFGNGASEDHSLFAWIHESCVGDAGWVLACMGALLASLLVNKLFRHNVLAGRVSERGGIFLFAGVVFLAVVAFIIGHTALSYISFIALVAGIVIAFHGAAPMCIRSSSFLGCSRFLKPLYRRSPPCFSPVRAILAN